MDDRARVSALGIASCVAKPINGSDLRKGIEAVVEVPEGQAAALRLEPDNGAREPSLRALVAKNSPVNRKVRDRKGDASDEEPFVDIGRVTRS
ncbi:MAG: hypothetical protein BMS9Abin37_1970 [Acidobacteriota bacterium]|nr:MAG: hypothetical protein BMS9Abin37_1970 [Acidobacteriota bacterium]